MGDFNLISPMEEKQGGNYPSMDVLIEFRNMIENCKLREMAFRGNRFTWDNGKEDEKFTQERIEMVFCNEEMLSLFPSASVTHLERCASDHLPILLNLMGVSEVVEGRKEIPFWFEAVWLTNQDSLEVIRNGWCNPGSMTVELGIQGKLGRCAVDLKDCGQSHFDHVLTKLRKVREKLKKSSEEGDE